MKTPLKNLTNLLRFSRSGSIPGVGLRTEWEVINICNAKCQTCLDWQAKPDFSILKTIEAKNIIQKLAASHVKSLTFTGGEPLLRKDLVELIQSAKEAGMHTELTTNGLLVNERRAKKLVDSGLDVIHISIDAANPCLNDELRGLKGYYDLAMSAVDNLKSMRGNSSPKIIIKAVVTSRNIKELVPLAELAIVKGLDGFCFNLAQVHENRNFVVDKFLLLKAGHSDTLTEQIDWLLKDYANILTGCLDYYRTLQKVMSNPAYSQPHRLAGKCNAIFIDAWGNVFTSIAKKEKLGNLKFDSFEKIWFGVDGKELDALHTGKEVIQIPESVEDFVHEKSQLTVKKLLKSVRPILNGVKLF